MDIQKISITGEQEDFLKRVVVNVANHALQSYGFSLQPDKHLAAEKTNADENINTDNYLRELDENYPDLSQKIKTSTTVIIQMISDLEEINQRAIQQIDRRLHLENVEKARGCRTEWTKLQRYPNGNEMSMLRNTVSSGVYTLKGDIESHVLDCNTARFGLFFGWREIDRIRGVLEELKEILIEYTNLVLLLSEIELAQGTPEKAKITLNEAAKAIHDHFPENNRMFDLTDEDFWVKKPQECIEKFESIIKMVQNLEPQMLLPESGRTSEI